MAASQHRELASEVTAKQKVKIDVDLVLQEAYSVCRRVLC